MEFMKTERSKVYVLMETLSVEIMKTERSKVYVLMETSSVEKCRLRLFKFKINRGS